MNIAIISGNLTRDPELTRTQGGTVLCKVRMAVNDRVKNQQTGEWSDKPNYLNVTVFGSQAERVSEWSRKGSQLTVEGRLSWREWEKDGIKREAVEIVANQVHFPPKSAQASSGDAPRHSDQGRAASPKEQFEAAGIPVDSFGEDLPF